MLRSDPRHWSSRALSAALVLLTLLGCSAAEAERCQVSGADVAAEAEALRESCERAVPAVEALWPEWSGQVVPIVRSQSALPLGVAAQVEDIVAVEDSVESSDRHRLLIGPGLVERLSPEGLDVVMRHELTHLAMRSTGTAPVPRWVSEGLAEWVGYQGVSDDRRDRREDLSSLRASTDAGRWTGTLPTAADLQGSDTRTDAYTAAWLAITILIDELGLEPVIEAMLPPEGDPGEPGSTESEAAGTGRFLHRVGVERPWLDGRWQTELERRTA